MSDRSKPQTSGNGDRTRAEQDSGRLTPLQKWLSIGLVALVVVAAVVAVTRGSDDGSEADVDVAQVSDVTLVGDPLSKFSGTPGDPAVGAAAPGFRGTSFDGREVVVEPGDGQAKVIGFFAHWCSHCQRELPRISEWLAQNDLPAGVEVIAVSLAVDADGGNYPPSAWFEREDWTATVLRDSAGNEVGDAYGLAGFPYMVAVNAQGRVVTRVSGELSTGDWEALLALAATGAAPGSA